MTGVATRDSWKTEPFGKVEPIPYIGSFSAEEFARLKAGFVPAEMEDKWFIYFEGDCLFLHRSWTGKPGYRVEFEPYLDGARVRRAYRGVGKSPMSDAEYEARLLGFLLSNLLLGRGQPFPVPRDEPNPAIFQHVIAGAGYRTVPVDRMRKRPWWKFWAR